MSVPGVLSFKILSNFKTDKRSVNIKFLNPHTDHESSLSDWGITWWIGLTREYCPDVGKLRSCWGMVLEVLTNTKGNLKSKSLMLSNEDVTYLFRFFYKLWVVHNRHHYINCFWNKRTYPILRPDVYLLHNHIKV